MKRNRETFSAPDVQKPQGQKPRPFSRLVRKLAEGKENRAREKEKSIDQRLDSDFEGVSPSMRRIFQKKEVPASLDIESPQRSQRPSGRGIQRQMNIDLDSVFPSSRQASPSGRRKFGTLFGGRNSPSEGRGARSFTTKTTGYWPAPTSQANAKGKGVAAMEGGAMDRQGKAIWPNHTLDAVERKAQTGRLGPDDYVAVAMDTSAYPYGTSLRSSAYPGIPFRVVDTGSAFTGKGTAKVDIATSNYNRMNQLTANNVRFERV